MKSVIFHIGLPKTGSTALQVFLARNHAGLLRNSIDYFDIGEAELGRTGRISSGNGAYLARSLLPTGNPARMPDPLTPVKQFMQAIDRSDADTGVISCELFPDADPSEFDRLLTALRSRDVVPKVMYFVREQNQLLSSSYVQQVKRHGYTGGPDQYVLDHYKHFRFLRYASWYGYLDRLFGKENLLCRTYEGGVLSEMGVFGAFCSALKIPTVGLNIDIRDVNTGMSSQELAIMVRLNKYRPRMRFSDAVVENSQSAGSVRSGERYDMLSEEVEHVIMAFFEEENRVFARSYFNREELFFVKLESATQTKFSDVTLDFNDVIDFAGGLLVRYDERLAQLEGRMGQAEARIGNLERR